MSRIEESLYNSVKKYGVRLNESDYDYEISNRGYDADEIKKVRAKIDRSKRLWGNVLYTARPGEGAVAKLRKDHPDYTIISRENAEKINRMDLHGVNGLILDGIERFPDEVMGKLLTIINDSEIPVLAVTYNKDELDQAVISSFRFGGVRVGESMKRRHRRRMTEDVDRQFEREASELCDAIRELASDEDALMNFENYLSMHFDEWFRKYASTPSGLISELKNFSQIR